MRLFTSLTDVAAVPPDVRQACGLPSVLRE